MKNALCVVLIVVLGNLGCSAQDTTRLLTNRRGVPILPAKGNWALGLSATPFFQYFGNLFNNSIYNAAPLFTTSSPTLIGKYMKNAKTAYRISIALNNTSSDGKNLVHNSLSPDPNSLVNDTKKYNDLNIVLGAGLEKRRGTGRLQGIYGFQGLIGISSTNSTYSYGNKITISNPVVPLTIWNANSANPAYTTNGANRPLESNSGTRFSLGVTGFVGVEYFIAPKVSFGGELGYAITYAQSSKGTSSAESFDFNTQTTNTISSDYYPNANTFSFGTVPTSNINLIVYF